jgi:spore germination protein KA
MEALILSEKKKSGLLNKIGSFLAYKPPQRDTFILPELEQEKGSHVASKASEEMIEQESGNGYREVDKEKEKTKKKPVKASEWKQIKGEKGTERGKKEGSDNISSDINVSLDIIKREFNLPANVDVVIREFKLAEKIDAFLVFIDGMADRSVINNFILRQLMLPVQFENYNGGCLFQYVTSNVLSVNQVQKIDKYQAAVNQVLTGVTALFINGYSSCLAIETRGFEKRSIGKPVTESVVYGSQEGFTENVKTSIIQIRRIIKNKDLVNELVTIGDSSHSLAAIMYLKSIANPAVVNEVKRRIKSIKTDFIIGDGMLTQFIEDDPRMFVPQVLTTERPDRTASHLLEGRVAIISDGAPFATIVPVNIFALIHSPEDSYLRWQYGTFLRMIRLFALLIALLLPGIYIALFNFHMQMVPTDLLIAVARAREAVPFPVIVEVLLMEIAFELIREAGIRVPGVIGTTLGIIGALILGQAAVAAGIVSPILIIVAAVTGLGNFAIPNYSLAFGIRILRFFFILMGGILGFFGISVGLVIIFALTASIKSFGVPFLAPAWPKVRSGKDMLIRYPVWEQENRPDELNTLEERRQPNIARGWVEDNPPTGKRE